MVRLHPRDTIVLVATVILAVAILLVDAFFHYPSWYARGFDPEWNCSNPGDGGPICIRNGPVPGGP
ncbi:MAG TPA: hypothetical protein VHA35_02320 [Dongiaceae bacterium]|jgi:hypothetical protein|nr:hypothetical protein [Dongiaceae bacterium]